MDEREFPRNRRQDVSMAVQREVVKLLSVGIVVTLILAAGCSKGTVVSKQTERGAFRVKLAYEGETLQKGRNEVRIHIDDSNGKSVEGAVIEITPWMPEHNHGTTWTPGITDKNNGEYQAVIPLFMGGHWEFRLKISKDGVEDRVVFDFPNVREIKQDSQ